MDQKPTDIFRHRSENSRECPSRSRISKVDAPEEFILNMDPLTFPMILKIIFSNLNGEDLESCKKVSQLWKSIIEQLHARHYEVTLKTFFELVGGELVRKENYVTIRKLYWSSKHSSKQKYTFPKALDVLLKKSMKKHNFAIDFQVKIPGDYDDDTFREFVSKIGEFVHTFSPGSNYETLGTFCKYLTRDFPNLHHLDLSGALFDDSSPPLDSSFKNQELKTVKKITLWRGLKQPEGVKFLLELTPNLEEIHQFPFGFLDVLISTGKSNLVRSIDFCFEAKEVDGMGGEIENIDVHKTLLEKFAQLAPKLKSFGFGEGGEVDEDDLYTLPINLLYYPTMQPSVQKILESSHKSLETMMICPPGNFDFSRISRMTSLRKVELADTNYLSLNEIPPYFGQQIKEIVLDDWEIVNLDTIRTLGNLFGSVKHFEFTYVLGDCDWEPVFTKIAEMWPVLEVMIINMKDILPASQTFDNFFTGIPDIILTQLKDPIRRAKFTREEIESFYENSAIRKLSKLKKLELDVSSLNMDIDDEDKVNKLRTITSLSKEFGFAFLPPAFTLVIREFHWCVIPDMEEALLDVVRFEMD